MINKMDMMATDRSDVQTMFLDMMNKMIEIIDYFVSRRYWAFLWVKTP